VGTSFLTHCVGEYNIPEEIGMSSTPAPKLQPPGAGLPWWERLVAKYVVFPRACRKRTWAGSDEEFQEEGAKALGIFDSLPVHKRTERVLIRRFPGIEDSSRFWSAAMTVEHLVIVGNGIRQIIDSLRRGELPERTARVEDVKPSGSTTPESVRSDFVRLLGEATQPATMRGEGPRFNHPWFGPIDAYQWHCLLGLHQGLHRRQLELIRAGLGQG
jgi:hypothetical protein